MNVPSRITVSFRTKPGGSSLPALQKAPSKWKVRIYQCPNCLKAAPKTWNAGPAETQWSVLELPTSKPGGSLTWSRGTRSTTKWPHEITRSGAMIGITSSHELLLRLPGHRSFLCRRHCPRRTDLSGGEFCNLQLRIAILPVKDLSAGTASPKSLVSKHAIVCRFQARFAEWR